MVEHVAVNRRVLGSSPRGAANADVAQLAEQLICNQQVTGSIPAIGSTCRWARQTNYEK